MTEWIRTGPNGWTQASAMDQLGKRAWSGVKTTTPTFQVMKSTSVKRASPSASPNRSHASRKELIATLDAQIAAEATSQDRGAGQEKLTGFGYGEKTSRRTAIGGDVELGVVIAGLLVSEKKGRAEGAAFVERRFANSRAAEAVTKALNTTGTSTGGALIPQAFSAQLIELLRAEVVVRRAGPQFYEMPGGNLTLPRIIGGATAAYMSELDQLTASQQTFDDIQLNAKKLTALVPVSNDLFRRSPLDVATILRDDLVQTIARREDLGFMLGDGSKGSPVGFLNRIPASQAFSVTPFIAFDNGTLATQTIGTLTSLQATLRMQMAPMRKPTWISNPLTFGFLETIRDQMGGFLLKDEIKTGKLLGFPFFASQQLASNLAVSINGSTDYVGALLFLVDFADVIIADTLELRIDTSDAATYADSTGATVSTFSRDQTAFRAMTEGDIGLRHTGSVIVATLPGWAPPGTGTSGGSPFYNQALSGDGSAAASTWGAPVTGSNVPGNVAANAPGGVQPGRA